MQMNTDDFPLVWTRYKSEGDGQSHALFEQFEALLALQRPFVLLNDEGLASPGDTQTQDERKQISLWMKRNKTTLRSYVKGAVFVEPRASVRTASIEFAVMYEKFWGYPMRIVASCEEAICLGKEILDR